MSERTGRLGSARVSHVGERVLTIANFLCEFALLLVERMRPKPARVTPALPR